MQENTIEVKELHTHHEHDDYKQLNWLDRAGMFLSSVCAVHCVITPFLLFTFPFLSYAFHHPLFHIGMALFIVPIGLFAFYRGFQHHHEARVLLLGSVGLLIIGGAALVPHMWLHYVGEIPIMIVGSSCLISAHYLNRRACKKCHHH